MLKRVKQIYRKMATYTKELRDIRKECNHPDYYITFFTWKVDSFDPQRVCIECESTIEGITKEEIKDCKEHYGMKLQPDYDATKLPTQ